MTERIRPADPDDAPFLSWAMLTAARSHLPRGWFDIALKRTESECLAFLRALAVTQARSWWHYSRFHVAEVDGVPAAALCDRCSDEFEAAVGAPGIRRYVKVL
jgi:hypothetical protein